MTSNIESSAGHTTKAIFRQSDKALVREIAGKEAVIVDLKTGECFQANATGLRIWNCIGNGATFAELRSRLSSVFTAEGIKLADDDLTSYVEELVKAGLVEVSTGPLDG